MVVPCYNYGRYLEWCVSTLLNQSGVRIRVLILDDASEDDTATVGARLAAGDSRVEYRRHARNAGHIATYNEGMLGWAAAEYSLLISADDGLAVGALARATQLMNAHPDVGLTYGMASIIDDVHAPIPTGPANLEHQIVTGTSFLQRCCQDGNPVPTPTAVVRTALQHRLGGYRADLPHSADMEMWMRFAFHGAVGVLRAIQGYYRLHGRNMSTQYYAALLGDRRDRVQACRPLDPSLWAAVPEFPAWYSAMCDRYADEALLIAGVAFESGDGEGYDECLEFAREIHSSLLQSSAWKKLQVKRFLGRRAMRVARSVWSGLLGRGWTAETPAPIRFVKRPGDIFGWWPDGNR